MGVITGADEGTHDGTNVGILVGKRVGTAEVDLEGTDEGEIVGDN